MSFTRSLGNTGLAVSHIALGTTELGYKYGIGPRDLPEEREAIYLLHRAVDMGVTFFDTAHCYGSAEERIGKSGIARRPGVVISTKCGNTLEHKKDINFKEFEKEIRLEIEQSRKLLDMDTLPLVLFHGGTAEQIRNGSIVKIMHKLKLEKKVAHCGISTRGYDAPKAALDSGFFEVLEVGFSIFDQRLRDSILPVAFTRGVGTIARSVFLKGALTPANRFLSDELHVLKNKYRELENFAKSIGTDVPTLALRFVLTETNLDTILIGTNKTENLKLAMAANSEGPLEPDIHRMLKWFAIKDRDLVDPGYWPAQGVADEKEGKRILPHLKSVTD